MCGVVPPHKAKIDFKRPLKPSLKLVRGLVEAWLLLFEAWRPLEPVLKAVEVLELPERLSLVKQIRTI